jgi:hypothetical protein
MLLHRMPRHTITPEPGEQIKVAYAAGVGLRELARNMGMSEGRFCRTRSARV